MTIEKLHKLFLESTGVCTDTRTLKKNQLFFALKGDNFDGNKYAIKALENKASYAIIDNPSITHKKCILVKDVLKTLQELSTYHRKKLNIPILALTGSNGKTTTKELIHSVLSKRYNCTSTKGNLNNHIGVPLTLLSMNSNTDIGVVEMGANHMKEIAFLCKIALPNYGYITNIGKAHLEGFGSEENILKGKTELYKFIKENNGTLFCNFEDPKLFKASQDINTMFFSNTNKDHTLIKPSKTSPFISAVFSNIEINSNLIGTYNFTNIAASICIGNFFNVEALKIKEAIENYTPTNNRSELLKKGTNEIILDAYNANPSSMKVALENLNSTSTSKKQKIAILGDMFELGKYAPEEHLSISELACKTADLVLLAGENFSKSSFKNLKIFTFSDTNSLLEYLKNKPISNSLILIKGSRGMKLEQLISNFES